MEIPKNLAPDEVVIRGWWAASPAARSEFPTRWLEGASADSRVSPVGRKKWVLGIEFYPQSKTIKSGRENCHATEKSEAIAPC
jgi:hypothetical protein